MPQQFFKPPSPSIPESSSLMFPPILPVREIDASSYDDLSSVNMSRGEEERKMTSPPSTAKCADSMVVGSDNDTDMDDVDSDDSLSKKKPHDTCDKEGQQTKPCKLNPNSGGRVPMHASLAELAESIVNMGGRDGYVKALAENPGYTRDKSRRRYADDDNDGIIYVILNRRNLKMYVGKTDNVDARFGEHFSGRGGTRVLQRAIAKYGPQNFVGMILLAGIQDQTELNSAEIAAIAHLDCLTTGERGYNLQLGGEGGKHAPETKEAMSVAQKERHAVMTAEEKAAMSAKKSAAMKERYASLTAEEKAAISAVRKEKHASRTSEEKAAISAAQKERYASRTPEEKAAISAAQKLIHASRTPEEKAATSAAMKNTLASRTPEEKAAISAVLKDIHASRTAEEKAAISSARKERHALQTAEEKAVLSAKLSTAQKKIHASRTPEEKAVRSAKMSAALKRKHASRTPEEKAVISAAISAARKLKASRTTPE